MVHDWLTKIGVNQPILSPRRRALSRLAVLTLSAFSLAACATYAAPPPPPPPPPPPGDLQSIDGSGLPWDWRGIILADDLARYQRLDAAWTLALRQAREMPGSGDLARLGDLIIPTATRDFVTPPTGNYRCRTVKLGSQADQSDLGYVVYGWFACRIEMSPSGLKLTKITGSQRPSGVLFPENDRQMVFLGSMALADDPPARSYGQRPERDLVAVLERVGETRWRLVIPWPRAESNLDLIELVPAPRARR